MIDLIERGNAKDALFVEMTVERTGQCTVPPSNPKWKVKRQFRGPRYFRVGPTFLARPPPACPGIGEGRRVARCETELESCTVSPSAAN